MQLAAERETRVPSGPLRHMQALVELLPRLELDAAGEPDTRTTEAEVLGGIAEHASASATAINVGLSAVGSLMAHAAPQYEDGSMNSDAIEALGSLFAELGAASAVFVRLAAACQQIPGRTPA